MCRYINKIIAFSILSSSITLAQRGPLYPVNQGGVQVTTLGSGTNGGGSSLTADGATIVNTGGIITAQGLSNTLGTTVLLYSNNNNYATLYIPLSAAASSNFFLNNQLQMFGALSSYGSCAGITIPSIGTNFKAGQAWSTMTDPVTGLSVTNYIQNAGNMYQIGSVPLQSGTNVTTATSPNIGQGMDEIWVASDPWMFGAFTGSGQQTGLIIYSNSVFHFLAQQSTNYDGRGDAWLKQYMTFDANHASVGISNRLSVSNIIYGVGNSSMSGGAGVNLLTNVGTPLYLDLSFGSPMGAIVGTNLILNGGTGVNAIAISGNHYIGNTHGGNDISISDNGGEIISFSPGSADNILVRAANTSIGWASGGGIIGTSAGGNAIAGNVGEFVQTLVAQGSAVTCTTAVITNVAQIILTAGDWDVDGNVNFTNTSATVTQEVAGIWPLTLSASGMPTDGSEVISGVLSTVVTGADSITLPRKRISTSSTTTNYLAAKSTFSAGTVKAYGQISARRVR